MDGVQRADRTGLIVDAQGHPVSAELFDQDPSARGVSIARAKSAEHYALLVKLGIMPSHDTKARTS